MRKVNYIRTYPVYRYIKNKMFDALRFQLKKDKLITLLYEVCLTQCLVRIRMSSFRNSFRIIKNGREKETLPFYLTYWWLCQVKLSRDQLVLRP